MSVDETTHGVARKIIDALSLGDPALTAIVASKLFGREYSNIIDRLIDWAARDEAAS